MNTVIYAITYHPNDTYPDLPQQETLMIHCRRSPSLSSLDTFPFTDDIIAHAYHTFPSTSLSSFFDRFLVESVRVFPIEYTDSTPILRFRAIDIHRQRSNPFGDTYTVSIDDARKVAHVGFIYDRTLDNDTQTLTFTEPLPIMIKGYSISISINSFIPIRRIMSVPMRIVGDTLVNAFRGLSTLVDISGLANWDVSGVTSLNGTFSRCSSLSDLSPIAGWNTSNVTNIDELFLMCESLKTTSHLFGWNVSRVTSMIATFSDCGIEDLDGLVEWDTSNVIRMSYMLEHMKAMDVDALSKWVTSNVHDMNGMFYNAVDLVDVNGLSKWDMENVRNVQGMFSGCVSLRSLEPLREWKTVRMVRLDEMFAKCAKLKDIDALGEWKTSTFHNLKGVFYECSSLDDVTALSRWDVGNVDDVKDMLTGCRLTLESIDVLHVWDLWSVRDSLRWIMKIDGFDMRDLHGRWWSMKMKDSE